MRVIRLYRDSFQGLSREMWLLSAVMLINRSGTMVLPFLSIYLTLELGFTLSQAGLVMACFGAGSVLGSFLGGKLTDKIGYYPVQFWSLVLSGSLFFLLMQMKTLWGFSLVVFLTTLMADAFRPAAMTAVSAYSKPKNLTRSISLIRLAINLGFSIGPAVGGFIAAGLGYSWLFILDGITCIAAGLFYWAVLNPRKVVKKEESEEVSQAPVRSVYRDSHYLWYTVFAMILAVVFFQLFNTLPVYLKDAVSLSEAQIGILLALNALTIAILEMPLVYGLENRFSKIALVRLGAIFIGLAFFTFVVMGSTILAAIVCFFFLTIGEMINFPFSNSLAIDRSTPRNRGQYMGLFTMSFSVAHIFAPLLGMNVADIFGYSTMWLLMAVLGMVAFLGFSILARHMYGKKAVAPA